MIAGRKSRAGIESHLDVTEPDGAVETELLGGRIMRDEQYESSALVAAVFGGLLAALVGGSIWALIAVKTDYEIGFAAWGIGALAGFAVVFFARGRKGLPLQVIAVAASLLGILLGKYGTYWWELKSAVEEQLGKEAAAQFSLFSSEVMRFFKQDFRAVFGGYDLLWVAFAVFSAWKIPRPARIEPPPARDEREPIPGS
jgi:hypothetical protein